MYAPSPCPPTRLPKKALLRHSEKNHLLYACLLYTSTPNHLLYDLLYNPDTTLFMKKGADKGAITKNGLEMLLLQAFGAVSYTHLDVYKRQVLELAKIYKRVDGERVHLMQFVRFQKAADGTFFAAVKPQFNALPLAVDHFKDRFADQRWLIYDVKRQYGYYYNLTEMEEVTFEDPRQAHLVTGMLNETLMDNNERLFQELWKTYFKSICIKERWNPQKHRQDMPVRYWKYLTEKQ